MANPSMNWGRLAAILAIAALLAGSAMAQAKGEKKTLEGTLSDVMCGAKHSMMKNTTDKQCTIACAKQGSEYGLVVGDKVYTLKGKMSQFEKLAGEKVKVTGTVEGTTIQVSAITKGG